MARTKVLLYAELLPNIRQISVIAAFETSCEPGTIAELSADGRKINLRHGGAANILDLPGQSVATTRLQKPTSLSKELSWRLPVADLSSGTSVERGQGSEAPWSARDLGPSSRFSCRGCGALVVQEPVVKSWRDLPSENWAEMMDFWHCHKPDPEKGDDTQAGHNHNGDSNANRGYGSNTKFVAQPGVGFVDLTSFLLVESDCQNLETISSEEESAARPQTVLCKSCHAALGYVDIQAGGIKLHKWRLSSSSTSTPSSLTTPSISIFISAKLSSILQAQCSSKALLIPSPPSSSKKLHLWILQQSLFYSSSESRQTSRTFAMKVLWKPIGDTESSKLLDDGKAEDITLPGDAVKEIERSLSDSARLLPPSARVFQGWNVGLLERYRDEE